MGSRAASSKVTEVLEVVVVYGWRSRWPIDPAMVSRVAWQWLGVVPGVLGMCRWFWSDMNFGVVYAGLSLRLFAVTQGCSGCGGLTLDCLVMLRLVDRLVQ
jgi:hypothetical protein